MKRKIAIVIAAVVIIGMLATAGFAAGRDESRGFCRDGVCQGFCTDLSAEEQEQVEAARVAFREKKETLRIEFRAGQEALREESIGCSPEEAQDRAEKKAALRREYREKQEALREERLEKLPVAVREQARENMANCGERRRGNEQRCRRGGE